MNILIEPEIDVDLIKLGFISSIAQKEKRFRIEIEEALCKGCLICVYACNKLGGRVLRRSDRRALLGGFYPTLAGDCIGCRWCERLCPDLCISVEEE